MSFIVAFSLTFFLSFIPEWFLKPRPLILSRLPLARAIHGLVLGLIFLLVFLVLRRPYFAGLVAIGTLCVFVIVSNAKVKALREPLVFSDIAMFSQAFKHPRLYLPFLGVIPAIMAPLLAIAFIITVMKIEPAISLSLVAYLLIFLVIITIAFLLKKASLRLTFSLDPDMDIKKYGLISCLTGYAFQARTAGHQKIIESALLSSPMHGFGAGDENKSSENKPNIIAIQSESFFDARLLDESIEPSILKNHDQFLEESSWKGRLNVPAWGANTMRTEFSFLSGVPSIELGFYRFYPYQYLADQTLPSLANNLSKQGYYCVCIHPHPASFFGRDRLFPQMGFDEFIDIESFDKNETFGPYISDKAVTEKILETLQAKSKHGKPVFIFAITMENHGPLHLEKASSEDVDRLYRDSPPRNHNDLTVYLRHLKNADLALADLGVALRQSEDDTMLCFYGDHIPSMPNIYDTTGYENDQTDYFIWHNKGITSRGSKSSQRKDLDTEQLAEYLLHSRH